MAHPSSDEENEMDKLAFKSVCVYKIHYANYTFSGHDDMIQPQCVRPYVCVDSGLAQSKDAAEILRSPRYSLMLLLPLHHEAVHNRKDELARERQRSDPGKTLHKHNPGTGYAPNELPEESGVNYRQARSWAVH